MKWILSLAMLLGVAGTATAGLFDHHCCTPAPSCGSGREGLCSELRGPGREGLCSDVRAPAACAPSVCCSRSVRSELCSSGRLCAGWCRSSRLCYGLLQQQQLLQEELLEVAQAQVPEDLLAGVAPAQVELLQEELLQQRLCS